METATIIGILAGTLTTTSLVPQVVKAWKTRHTRDVSMFMFLMLFTGVGLWLIYGLAIGDLPVILANTVTIVLVVTMIVLKLRFG